MFELKDKMETLTKAEMRDLKELVLCRIELLQVITNRESFADYEIRELDIQRGILLKLIRMGLD
jgi:hypothetical protein